MAQGTTPHIEIHPEVAAVASRFAGAGAELYVVGGWLRDKLRGAASKDVDMATDLSPARVKQLLDPLGPIYTMGEKFGTIGLRLDDYAIEITSFRSDTYTPGSRHPEIEPAGDIAADLARRDFTINAMALRVAPEPGTLVDPFDGSSDLDRWLIRTPGPPEPRMAEDPLRMMRAVRFAAQLGFAIDTDLLAVLSGRAEMLDGISCERRRDELEKILVSPHPDQGVSLLVDTGLMRYVVP